MELNELQLRVMLMYEEDMRIYKEAIKDSPPDTEDCDKDEKKATMLVLTQEMFEAASRLTMFKIQRSNLDMHSDTDFFVWVNKLREYTEDELLQLSVYSL